MCTRENVVGADGYADGTPRKYGEPVKRYVKVNFDIAVEVFKSDVEKVEEQGSIDGDMNLQVAFISKAGFDLHCGISGSSRQDIFIQTQIIWKKKLNPHLPTSWWQ